MQPQIIQQKIMIYFNLAELLKHMDDKRKQSKLTQNQCTGFANDL